MTNEPKVVLVGSLFEETPEGLYRMDHIRRVEEVMRADLARRLKPEVMDRLDAEIDRFVFGVTDPLFEVPEEQP